MVREIRILFLLIKFWTVVQCRTRQKQSSLLVKPFKVFMPEGFEAQATIASVLNDMDAEIGALESKLEKARKLKQGMMYDLLTGKIRLI